MTAEEKREKARVQAQAWREANRERHRAYTREYRRQHAEECYRKNREWAEAHPDLVNEYHRKSRRKHPELYRETTRRYRAKHPGFSASRCAARRARRKGSSGNVALEEWRHIVASFGGRCASCGATGRLSMDHIKPLSIGGLHVASNIQPLCIPCNSRKHTKTIDYRLTSPFFDRGFYERRFD